MVMYDPCFPVRIDDRLYAEYLGKKIEGKEMKLVAICPIAINSLPDSWLLALAVATPGGLARLQILDQRG